VIDGHISEDRAKAALDALLRRTWRTAFGNRRGADMLAIDANYAKEDVRDWAKRHPQDRVIMVRGIKGDAAPAMTLVKEDKTADGQVIKTQKRFWNVGVSSLKAALYKALNKTDPLAKGYCGYPKGLTEEFFKQLCAEQRRAFKVRGATEWRWIQIDGQANEVLDTEMQAEAAARRVGWKRFTDKDWDKLTAEREQPAPDRQLDLEEPNLLARGPAKVAAAGGVRAKDHDIEAPQAGPDDRGGVRSGISRPGTYGDGDHGVHATPDRRAQAGDRARRDPGQLPGPHHHLPQPRGDEAGAADDGGRGQHRRHDAAPHHVRDVPPWLIATSSPGRSTISRPASR
jgi:hypothetical protein